MDTPSEARQALERRLAEHSHKHREFGEKHGKRWATELADDLDAAIRALRQGGEAVAWGATAQTVVGFISVHKSKEDAEQAVAGWATGRVVPLYALPPPPAEGEAA